MELGARLPTEEEALGIAGNNDDLCGWPNGWVTWTAEPPGPNGATLVYDGGAVGGAHPDAGFGALCIR